LLIITYHIGINLSIDVLTYVQVLLYDVIMKKYYHIIQKTLGADSQIGFISMAVNYGHLSLSSCDNFSV